MRALPIGTERVSHAGSGDEPLVVRAPYDGRELARVPACGPAEVDQAVTAARAALGDDPLPAWRRAEILEALRPGALRALRRHYILNHIADREGLRAADADVDAAIAERIAPEKTSVAETRRRLARSGELEDLRFHLTMERVFDWLRERSEITFSEAPDGKNE